MSQETRRNRIIKLELDQASLAATTADAEHERRVAIFDLIEENSFSMVDAAEGPYLLRLSTQDKKLVVEIADEEEAPIKALILSLAPFRRIIRDYFMICESYYEAIRTATAAQIETIDMARRGLHNEGSELLLERLAGKVDMDFDTARRLFTLICALHRPR